MTRGWDCTVTGGCVRLAATPRGGSPRAAPRNAVVTEPSTLQGLSPASTAPVPGKELDVLEILQCKNYMIFCLCFFQMI